MNEHEKYSLERAALELILKFKIKPHSNHPLSLDCLAKEMYSFGKVLTDKEAWELGDSVYERIDSKEDISYLQSKLIELGASDPDNRTYEFIEQEELEEDELKSHYFPYIDLGDEDLNDRLDSIIMFAGLRYLMREDLIQSN